LSPVETTLAARLHKPGRILGLMAQWRAAAGSGIYLSAMKQRHLSKARMWERQLKARAWGVHEHEMPLLPLQLRERIWNEAMLRGPKCIDPDPTTLALIAATLADLEADDA